MEIKQGFCLNENCFLVAGAKRGAIYDLGTGNVYSIDALAMDLIKKCENGQSIELALIDRGEEFKISAISYLETVARQGLGKFLMLGDKVNKIKIEEPSILDFIWLEIVGGCNLRCFHCYLGENPISIENSAMKISHWQSIIEQAYEIGCRKLQFIGGEPLIDYDKLSDLIVFSKKTGYDFIEVYTNATLLNNGMVDFLHDYGVNVAVSVYGANPEIHDRVTRINGSFSKTIKSLRTMVSKGIDIRIGVVAMSLNEQFIDRTVDFLKNDIGVKNIKVDPIRPIGCGCRKDLVPVGLVEKQRKVYPEFSKCNSDKFRRSFYGHNCFSKNLCITNDGKAMPCIMEREIVLGDTLKESLEKILSGEHAKKIRNLSKDLINVCKNCEYRYCCFDCRPKAKQESGGDLLAKPSNCFYDPCFGVWQNP